MDALDTDSTQARTYTLQAYVPRPHFPTKLSESYSNKQDHTKFSQNLFSFLISLPHLHLSSSPTSVLFAIRYTNIYKLISLPLLPRLSLSLSISISISQALSKDVHVLLINQKEVCKLLNVSSYP